MIILALFFSWIIGIFLCGHIFLTSKVCVFLGLRIIYNDRFVVFDLNEFEIRNFSCVSKNKYQSSSWINKTANFAVNNNIYTLLCVCRSLFCTCENKTLANFRICHIHCTCATEGLGKTCDFFSFSINSSLRVV